MNNYFQNRKWSLAVLAFLTFTAQGLRAMDYHLRALTGVYQSTETFKNAEGGQEKNDSQAALASVYFDVRKIGSNENRFTFEFRDRYDSFGNVDPDQPRLVTSTEPEVRQLVFRAPQIGKSLFASLGRFPILDAATIAHDGIEGGYRFSPKLSVGLFGGLYPERKDGNALQLSEQGTQAGLYMDFDDRSSSSDTHTYIGSALISRKPKVENSVDEISARTTTTTGISYTNIVFQPSRHLRLTLMSLLDISPKPRAKNFWSSYMQRIAPQLSSFLYITRIDPTEYDKLRDLRDTLAPSVLTRGHLLLKHVLTRNFSLWYDAAYGVRSVDKLIRQQFGGRLIFSRVGRSPIGMHLGLWSRKNYESNDTVLRGGLHYVTDRLDLSATQQVITEKKKDGTQSRPLITDLSGSWFFSRQFMGTVGVEYAVDEKVTIVSGLIGIGMRLSSDQPTPAGSTPKPPESL